ARGGELERRLQVGERLRDPLDLDVRIALLEGGVERVHRRVLAAPDLLVPDEQRHGRLRGRRPLSPGGGGAGERCAERGRRQDESGEDGWFLRHLFSSVGTGRWTGGSPRRRASSSSSR